MPAELKFFSGANEETEGGHGHWPSARPQKGWHPHPARLDRQQPSAPPPLQGRGLGGPCISAATALSADHWPRGA